MTDENGMKWPFPFSNTVWYMQTKIKTRNIQVYLFTPQKQTIVQKRRATFLFARKGKM